MWIAFRGASMLPGRRMYTRWQWVLWGTYFPPVARFTLTRWVSFDRKFSENKQLPLSRHPTRPDEIECNLLTSPVVCANVSKQKRIWSDKGQHRRDGFQAHFGESIQEQDHSDNTHTLHGIIHYTREEQDVLRGRYISEKAELSGKERVYLVRAHTNESVIFTAYGLSCEHRFANQKGPANTAEVFSFRYPQVPFLRKGKDCSCFVLNHV